MDGIGSKIRKARKSKKLTLNELSDLTGLSQGFLSQVERSKSSVTLQSLSKISDALQISRSYFFDEIDENPKKDEINSFTTTTNYHSTNFFYQSLIGDITNPAFEPMIAVLLSEEKKPSPSSHSGQEFVYVLSGELTLILENNEKILYEGDSFHIESNISHTWFNATKNVTKLIYVHSNSS